MEILGTQSYADYIPQYQGIPIDRVDDLGKTLETRYYANMDNSDKLRQQIANIKVEDRNNPILQQALDHVDKALAGYNQNGNWEDAHKAVRSSALEFASDPTVKAAIESKASYDDWSKRMDDYMKDKDANPEFAAYYHEKAATDNAGQITKDPVTGAIKGKFQGTIPQKDLGKEILEEIDKLAGKWKPDTRSGQVVQMKDKSGKVVNREIMYKSGANGGVPGYFDVLSHEYIDANEVRNSMMNRVLSDPRYSAYLGEASKIDRWKQMKSTGKADIDITDFYNPLNPQQGLFKTEKELNDWAASIRESGFDINKLTQNPDMMAAYWQSYKKVERVKHLIEPTVQAISYDKYDHKYLQDWMTKDNLDFQHDMAKINAKAKWDIKIKEMEIDAKKLEKDNFVIKGTTPIEDASKDNLSVTQLQSQIVNKGALLAQKSRDLAAMEKKDTKDAAYYKLKSEVAILKDQQDLQKTVLIAKMNQVIDKPENAATVDKLWDNVQTAQQKFGNDVVTSGAIPKLFKTKEEFKTFIKENPEYLAIAEESTMGVGRIGTNIGRMWHNLTNDGGNGTTGGLANKAQYIKNEIWGNTGHTLLNQAKDVSVGDITGWKASSYGGDFYDKHFNKPETTYAINNPGSYTIISNDGQATTLDKVLEKYDIGNPENVDANGVSKDKFSLKLTRTDGDFSSNGVVRLPSKATIFDNKGKVVKEFNVYQHADDGGANEMMQQGLTVIKNMPKGSNERQQGIEQYAKGRYANIITKDEERKWNGVDNINLQSALSRATVSNVDGTAVKFIRLPYTTVDANGTKNKEYLYHAVILDTQGNPISMLANSDTYGRPDVINAETGTSVYSAGFKSINDVKLELAKKDLNNRLGISTQ